jgi:hypothetical protein
LSRNRRPKIPCAMKLLIWKADMKHMLFLTKSNWNLGLKSIWIGMPPQLNQYPNQTVLKLDI